MCSAAEVSAHLTTFTAGTIPNLPTMTWDTPCRGMNVKSDDSSLQKFIKFWAQAELSVLGAEGSLG